MIINNINNINTYDTDNADNINKEKIKLTEYEIERIINKQLFDEKYITYDIYHKVNAMILRDIENQTRKLENIKTEFKKRAQNIVV